MKKYKLDRKHWPALERKPGDTLKQKCRQQLQKINKGKKPGSLEMKSDLLIACPSRAHFSQTLHCLTSKSNPQSTALASVVQGQINELLHLALELATKVGFGE